MTTLTVNIKDKKSEKALKAVLDALGLSYKVESTLDDTKLISSSAAMIQHLDTAKRQDKKGKGIKVSLDDVWK